MPRPPDSSHPSWCLGAGCRVPEALFVAVSVSTEVVPVAGLRVIAASAAELTIVLAVLQTLLKVRSVCLLTIVAVSVLVAILVLILFLLCGNRGGPASRAESGEGDPKSQHP